MFRCTGKLVKMLVKGQAAVWKQTTFNREWGKRFTLAERSLFRTALNQYSACLRQNSRFYVMTLSGYAKTKYEIQNLWDRLVHGRREKDAAQVAFMITGKMKNELGELDYPSEEIDTLKPLYAQYILANKIPYTTWKTAKSELIEKCEEEEKRKQQERAAEARDVAQGAVAYGALKSGNSEIVAVDGSSPDSFDSTGGSHANGSSLVVVDNGSSDFDFDSDCKA